MTLNQFPEIIFATSKASDGNMSFLKGDRDEVLKNREKFLKTFNLSLDSIVVSQLEHGTNIITADKNDLGKGARGLEDAPLADVLITNKPNIYLFMLTADCIPLALFDPKNHILTLVHISWKTAYKDILRRTIEKMAKDFNCQPQDLIAQFGPSLGPCCYKNLLDLAQKDDPRWQPFISQDKNGTFGVDLWGFTENELKNLGLLPENIYNPKICTYHSNKYFSYKKFQWENLETDSRIATVLGLKQ